MNRVKFHRISPDDLIIVSAFIEDKFEFRLAIDTAATHTTLDINMLYMAGYELKDSVSEVAVETSNGVITVECYRVKTFESIGKKIENFDVQVYDFLAHGITSDYDGVLGLDFFQNSCFTIDLIKNEIFIINE
jgi:hypothetical protein